MDEHEATGHPMSAAGRAVPHRATAVAAGVLVIAGCGGSGGDQAAQGGYPFVTPTLNSQRVYAETIIDNSNNTINLTYTDTVTAVSPDGSYTVLSEDPGHESVIVNGTNYSIRTETQNFDSTGHETSYSFQSSSGGTVTCTYDPHGAGPVFPLTVGEEWTLDYTLSCNGASPISYTQSGQVVDVESVTVPAGTVQAAKLQSSISYTDAQGTTRNEATANWRDLATMYSVREQQSIAVSGTLPATGYPTSIATQLQSMTQ